MYCNTNCTYHIISYHSPISVFSDSWLLDAHCSILALLLVFLFTYSTSVRPWSPSSTESMASPRHATGLKWIESSLLKVLLSHKHLFYILLLSLIQNSNCLPYLTILHTLDSLIPSPPVNHFHMRKKTMWRSTRRSNPGSAQQVAGSTRSRGPNQLINTALRFLAVHQGEIPLDPLVVSWGYHGRKFGYNGNVRSAVVPV